jgi:hypothetical protein
MLGFMRLEATMTAGEQPAPIPEVRPFYNQEGRAVLYLYQGIGFFLYDGTPVAWLQNGENIYSYEGRYLGRLQKGWICDLRGYAAFFSDGCTGGPPRPEPQPDPARSPHGTRRARFAAEPPPRRIIRISAWSPNGDESFFRV